MPISTDSTAWEEGKDLPTTEHVVLDLLKENPDKAYNIRELAEEILEIDWTGYEEQQRKREELPEGEYLDDDEYKDFASLAIYRETDILKLKIRSLLEKGLVDVKEVDATDFGPEIPDDWEFVMAYSYHQE